MTLKVLIISNALVVGLNCFGQTDTIFLTIKRQKCNRSEAVLFYLVNKVETKYIVTETFPNKAPLMIAECSKVDPLIKNGKCTFYSGQLKTREGIYTDNKPTGQWIIWDSNGKDSSIAEYKTDGSLNYIRRSEKETKYKDIFTVVEEMPSFIGGDKALKEFLAENLIYPTKEKDAGIQGMVYIEFVVDKDGNIRDVYEGRGIKDGSGLTEEAIRLIRTMPKWKPGHQNGEAVDVKMMLPINFSF